ncbi:MAG: hypothetical protein E7172_04945 [Firmicutes bacterium]|nr:hypothetical protein [Bacillota bacterium]
MKKIIFLMLLLWCIPVKALVSEKPLGKVYYINDEIVDKMYYEEYLPIFKINKNNLTEKEKEEINLIIYYNYYTNPSSLNYAETQILIYKYLNNYDYKLYNEFKEEIKVDYNKINKIIENHYQLPSFVNKTYYGDIFETIKLKDENNVFKNYRVKTELNYSIETLDEINITLNEFGKHEIILEKNNNLDEIKIIDNIYFKLGNFNYNGKFNIEVNSIEINFTLLKPDKNSKYNIIDYETSQILGILDFSETNYLNIQVKDVDKILIEEISYDSSYEKNANIYLFDTKDKKIIDIVYDAEYKKYDLNIKSNYYLKNQDILIPIEYEIYDIDNNLIIEDQLEYGRYIIKIDDFLEEIILDEDFLYEKNIILIDLLKCEENIVKITNVFNENIEFNQEGNNIYIKNGLKKGIYYLENDLGEQIVVEINSLNDDGYLIIDDSFEKICLKDNVIEDQTKDEFLGEIEVEFPEDEVDSVVINVDVPKTGIELGKIYVYAKKRDD